MEPSSNRRRAFIGMRIIKTVIAVFLCGVFGYLRGQPAFYSMIAAVICLQNSTDKTITASANRAIGTLLGGLLGVATLYLLRLLGLMDLELLRYLVVALMVIPLIQLTLLIKKPSISAFACVVLISITVNHGGDDAPALFALQRTLDTLVGVAVTCLVDLALPYRAAPEEKKP